MLLKLAASSAATAVAVAAAAAAAATASSSVLKYLNVQNVHDHLAHANALNASALLPCNNSFNNRRPTTPQPSPPPQAAAATMTTTTASTLQLSSPSTNAYTNFMYANWIDLHTKIPDQTKYLFCLQGNLSIFPIHLKFLLDVLHIEIR